MSIDPLQLLIFEDAHIFDFTNSPYEAQFYKNSFNFKSGRKKIGIVDQFQGKRPIILNKEIVINKKELNILIVQTLILDSHIVDYLHRYISGKGKIDDDTKSVVKDFLVHVSQLKCDYSPIFYLAENWAKSTKEQFIKTSSEKLSSILKLHSMDEEIFINDGTVVYKDEALNYYCNLYGAHDLDACGLAWAISYANDNELSELDKLSNISYACLLKMVLILTDPHEIDKKIRMI